MKRVFLIGAVMLALGATPVYAGFNVVSKTKPVATESDPASIGLIATRFVGDAPGPIDVRHGFGRDVTLKTALQQIAPTGWHAQLLPGELDHFDRDKKVTWHGGRPWTDVLDILAASEGFTVDVYWSRHLLLIGHKLATSPAPKHVAHTAHSKMPVVPKVPTWVAATGTTLRQALTAWCKTAGWQLRWSADFDYPVTARLTFRGKFVDAVTQAFDTYKDARKPLYADVYPGQKLIVVSTSSTASTYQGIQ